MQLIETISFFFNCMFIFCLAITVSLITFAAVNKTSGDIVYLPNENNSTVWPGMIYVKYS